MKGISVAAFVILAASVAMAQGEPRPIPRPEVAEAASVAASRPQPRPGGAVEIMSDAPRAPSGVAAVATSPWPVPRLDLAVAAARSVRAALARPVPEVDLEGLVALSKRPDLRPSSLLRPAMGRPGAPGGGLCGRASLAGERIPPVAGRGACGIADAVRLRAVGGVPLSRAVRLDCVAARALDDWVTKGVVPLVGGRGGGVARIEVAAGYACRSRNNQSGARLSEHSFGRAIDVSALRLVNGDMLSVLADWGRGADGRILESLWRAACGPFTTVLGPRADRFHQDHFHLDVARGRTARYCR